MSLIERLKSFCEYCTEREQALDSAVETLMTEWKDADPSTKAKVLSEIKLTSTTLRHYKEKMEEKDD